MVIVLHPLTSLGEWCGNYPLLAGLQAPSEKCKYGLSRYCSCRSIKDIPQIHQWYRLKQSPYLRLCWLSLSLLLSLSHTHTLPNRRGSWGAPG